MGEIADALRQARRSSSPTPAPPAAPPADRSVRRREMLDARETERDAEPVERPASERPQAEDASTTSELMPKGPPDVGPIPVQPLRRDAELDDPWRPARIAVAEPQSQATQQYRRLALRVRDLADRRSARSIVVTSAESGDGKTTTSCNLAVQLVSLDHELRVALVDLDLRRANVASAFGLHAEHPVDAVLDGDTRIGEALIETDVPGLSVLALSRIADNPESLLARSTLKELIRELERRFDFVIIDTPPVLAVSDAQVILRYASAALFVARAGRTPVRAVRRALEHLPAPKLLGTFMNASPESHGLSEYSYYYSGEPYRSTDDASTNEDELRDTSDTSDASDASDASNTSEAPTEPDVRDVR